VASPYTTVQAAGSNTAIEVQVYKAGETVTNYQRRTRETRYVAAFKAVLPPLGFATFVLSTGGKTQGNAKVEPMPVRTSNLMLENEFFSLTFSRASGRLTGMKNKVTGTTIKASQDFCAYTSSEGDKKSDQASGAYIFRPVDSVCESVTQGGPVKITTVVGGPLVQEIRQVFAPWLTQTIRLTAGARFAEFEWTVGPINLEGSGANHTLLKGQEVVSKFTTSIKSGGKMLTDSNGREMLARTKDYRPTWDLKQTEPVAGNYFPVNAAAAIRDSQAQLTVLVGASQGVATLKDGHLELMVHRRVLKDDGRGVGEPLDETQYVGSYATDRAGQHFGPGLIVRGLHLVSLEPPETAASVWRPLADRIFASPRLLFSAVPSTAVVTSLFSALTKSLPANVEVMTLEALPTEDVLLRLSHQFGLGEDKVLSNPVTIDLSTLFDPSMVGNITSAREVSLTNNQDKADILARRQMAAKWHENGEKPHPWRNVPALDYPRNPLITLGPLEIKAFLLRFSELTPSSKVSPLHGLPANV
jgi:lysosomal alpha-mannosidase